MFVFVTARIQDIFHQDIFEYQKNHILLKDLRFPLQQLTLVEDFLVVTIDTSLQE